MLDLDPARGAQPPRDAATLVLLRDGADGLEVFCVERHAKSGFGGGALVFPGGKVDPSDSDPAWEARSTPPRATTPTPTGKPIAESDAALRALAIAACRESLEEAAILPITGGALTHDELLALRKVGSGPALRAALAARGLRLDLAALHPFARWVTPAAESRRFDARFFVCVAPEGQPGAHDEHETTKSFWTRPEGVLARAARGEVQLLPPTHRNLELLAAYARTEDVLAAAAHTCKDPICPELVMQEGALALVLPGDPEHGVREPRVPGKSRFVLRGERWVPEDPPARSA